MLWCQSKWERKVALSLLSRAQSAFDQPAVTDALFGDVSTDCSCYVIGDIHGRVDLLDQLLDKINLHIGAAQICDPHLVFVGDYIDRGPDSVQVLERLQSLSRMLPGHVHCLMGNHERMLLDFLDYPVYAGPLWMRHGGLQTLDSFGITGVEAAGGPQHMQDVADMLEDALFKLLPGTLTWLEKLPLSWQSGNLFVSHAGANPLVPRDRQTPNSLLWGHAAFQDLPRRDGIWVACGHKACKSVMMDQGRILLDTGAVQTGKLSALATSPDHAPVVLQT